MNIRERLLGNTFVYKTFKNLVSPPRLVAKTIEEFLQVPDGSTVLDLGCGYGDIAHFYTNRCRYVGIDSNESYIKEAQRRNANSDAEFLVGDVSDSELRKRGPFDLVLMTGVLHHLPNEHVIDVVNGSKDLVSASGRFVAIEPVFSPDQRLSARLIIASDRGRFVRDKDGYLNLLRLGFEDVNGEVIHGRLRIPYSHVVLTCKHS
jgi:cyclopropane fatty-acyl-phospholipid synthase-like methyltransferase